MGEAARSGGPHPTWIPLPDSDSRFTHSRSLAKARISCGSAGTRIGGPHSRSYVVDGDGRRVDGTDWNMTFADVGGALVTSPRDLTRFTTELFDGRLLPPAQLAEMRRTVEADPDRVWPGARYGLGLISTPLSCGGTWWGHAGTVPGGHRALVGVGPGGRSVAVALNEVPDSLQAELDSLDLVDSSLCENRSSEGTRA